MVDQIVTTISDQTAHKPPCSDPHVPESWLVYKNMTSPFYNWAVPTSNQEEEQNISLVQQQIWPNLAESSVFMTVPISPSKKLIAWFVFYSTQRANAPPGHMLAMLAIIVSVGMCVGNILWIASNVLKLKHLQPWGE